MTTTHTTITAPLTLSDLSDDVIFLLFEHVLTMSPSDTLHVVLARLGRVCVRWNRLAKSDHLWHLAWRLRFRTDDEHIERPWLAAFKHRSECLEKNWVQGAGRTILTMPLVGCGAAALSVDYDTRTVFGGTWNSCVVAQQLDVVDKNAQRTWNTQIEEHRYHESVVRSVAFNNDVVVAGTSRPSIVVLSREGGKIIAREQLFYAAVMSVLL